MRNLVARQASEAESYWARTAPELSNSERECIAHLFGTARNKTFTPLVWRICEQVNSAHSWDGENSGFKATRFGLILFLGVE